MPQDLFSDSLVASPEAQTPQTPRLDVSDGSTATGHDGYNEFTIHRQEGKPTSAQQPRTNKAKISETNDLHPYVQTLSLSHLDSCVALENAVFPEEERCSREKVGPPPSGWNISPFLSEDPLSMLFSRNFWPFGLCESASCKRFLAHHSDLPRCLLQPDDYQSFLCISLL